MDEYEDEVVWDEYEEYLDYMDLQLKAYKESGRENEIFSVVNFEE